MCFILTVLCVRPLLPQSPLIRRYDTHKGWQMQSSVKKKDAAGGASQSTWWCSSGWRQTQMVTHAVHVAPAIRGHDVAFGSVRSSSECLASSRDCPGHGLDTLFRATTSYPQAEHGKFQACSSHLPRTTASVALGVFIAPPKAAIWVHQLPVIKESWHCGMAGSNRA